MDSPRARAGRPKRATLTSGRAAADAAISPPPARRTADRRREGAKGEIGRRNKNDRKEQVGSLTRNNRRESSSSLHSEQTARVALPFSPSTGIKCQYTQESTQQSNNYCTNRKKFAVNKCTLSSFFPRYRLFRWPTGYTRVLAAIRRGRKGRAD